MPNAYEAMNDAELKAAIADLEKQADDLRALDLKLDMARGKPSPQQTALSRPMLDLLGSESDLSDEGVAAVQDFNLDIADRECIVLVGPSGCGKSTTLRTIAGQVKAQAGSITYNGEELLGKPSDELVKRGITLVPEGRRVFPDMTVLENMKIGAYLRHDKLDDDIEWCYELFPRLKERHWQLAGTLSGGEQQMLAVARALMSRPKLMMMDEPSLGLAPLIVRDIFQIIREINKQGVTILLIEQNANMALHTADRGYVMETGEIILEGAGRELLENPVIREAYLGK